MRYMMPYIILEEYIYKVWRFQNLIHKISLLAQHLMKRQRKLLSIFLNLLIERLKLLNPKRIKISQRQSKLNFIFNDFQKIIKEC